MLGIFKKKKEAEPEVQREPVFKHVITDIPLFAGYQTFDALRPVDQELQNRMLYFIGEEYERLTKIHLTEDYRVNIVDIRTILEFESMQGVERFIWLSKPENHDPIMELLELAGMEKNVLVFAAEIRNLCYEVQNEELRKIIDQDTVYIGKESAMKGLVH